MNDNLPHIELPEFATLSDRLVRSIEAAREAVSLRVGYEVEVASFEPVERDGYVNMRVYWRRKAPAFTSCTETPGRPDETVSSGPVRAGSAGSAAS